MSGRQRPSSLAESKFGLSSQSSHPSFYGKDGGKQLKVLATTGVSQIEKQEEISFVETKPIGNGSFGVVYQAKLIHLNEVVAIKKVLQDRRFKNRELQIMKKLDHTNIVKLLYYFYSSGDKKDEIYLNLVLEFLPENMYRVCRQYTKFRQTMPIIYVKLYIYQLFRSLSFMHMNNLCHRDIKPQNLLLNPETGVLKLCDFGSAKQLIKGEPNVSYICSRYYRAPELIFGATEYTPQIDIWSAGCVMSELLLGQPLFPGESGVDQLVEIIKVLGTPSREQIKQMNPNYQEFKFPLIRAHPWSKVFRLRTPSEALDLVSLLLDYIPFKRLTPLEACSHSFFDELRDPNSKLPNNHPLPILFNFSSAELRVKPSLVSKLIPPHISISKASPSSCLSASSVSSSSSSSSSYSSSSSSSIYQRSSLTDNNILMSENKAFTNMSNAANLTNNSNNSNIKPTYNTSSISTATSSTGCYANTNNIINSNSFYNNKNSINIDTNSLH